MKFLHLFLSFLLFFCGVLVSSSVSPIESVLFLILAFCNSAVILFLFNAEFLGLTFIIIYVGAIAVLFLFVIMMLNVKIEEQDSFLFEKSKSTLVIRITMIYFLGLLGFFIFKGILFQDELFIFSSLHQNISIFDSLHNIDVLGQVLYNYFLICFLLAGLILLIALVGAIVLTLRFSSNQKTQSVFRQLSRTENLLSFFDYPVKK